MGYVHPIERRLSHVTVACCACNAVNVIVMTTAAAMTFLSVCFLFCTKASATVKAAFPPVHLTNFTYQSTVLLADSSLQVITRLFPGLVGCFVFT